MITFVQSSFHRVPPFLSTVDDPRASQGGILKGCSVCGGRLTLPGQDTVLNIVRLGPRYFQLSKVGRCKATRNGFSSRGR